jgi:hypothetical protein
MPRVICAVTGGTGADVVVEVAGIVQGGLEMTQVGGRYLWMGNIVPELAAEIIPHEATRQPKTIRGVLAYDRWIIPRALDGVSRTRMGGGPRDRCAVTGGPRGRPSGRGRTENRMMASTGSGGDGRWNT